MRANLLSSVVLPLVTPLVRSGVVSTAVPPGASTNFSIPANSQYVPLLFDDF